MFLFCVGGVFGWRVDTGEVIMEKYKELKEFAIFVENLFFLLLFFVPFVFAVVAGLVGWREW